jgi:NAD(P)-dependent dehydrogenase (short-subunit alcohol dehydrogenase family)
MATSQSVLVLGGATKNSIGAGIVSHLNDLGHLVFAPPQEVLDVTLPDDRWVEEFGAMLDECSPGYVVYAAGVNQLDWSWSLTKKTFDRIMDVNVWGFINVLRGLQLTGFPYSVLAITSDAASRPMRTSMAYCASKAALDQVIRVASRELAGDGWRINGLAPGKVDGTAMTEYVDARVLQIRGWTEAHAEQYELASSPIGRKVWPAEVATVACDVLLSTSLAWTGDIVHVNGGR